MRLKSAGLSALKVVLVVWPYLLILATVFFARQWAVSTPRFGLENVSVNVEELNRVNVKRLMSFIDLREGSNLFTIDLDALHNRIKTEQWIKDIRITRKLPDTVVIKITEFEPYAVVNLGLKYYVDHEGFLFKKLSGNDNPDYPVLSGFSPADFRADFEKSGKKVECLARAVSVLKAAELAGAVKRDDVSEVRYDHLTGYTLVLDTKSEVRLGTDDFELKLSRLKLIYDKLGDQAYKVSVVDLADPDQAVIKGLRKVDAG